MQNNKSGIKSNMGSDLRGIGLSHCSNKEEGNGIQVIANEPNYRVKEIDAAKGLAMLFVVFGHIVASEMPRDNAWYEVLKHAVYTFHMPFFMFISGFVFFYTFKRPANISSYFGMVKKRFERLMPAYFLFGAIVLAGKFVFSHWLHVDNLPADPIEGGLDLLLRPYSSAAKFLWYVYVLFGLTTLIPLVLRMVGGNLWLVLGISIAIRFLPGSDFLAWDNLRSMAMFFVIGCIGANYYPLTTSFLGKTWAWFCAIFMLALVLEKLIGLPAYIVGLSSIPAIVGLLQNTKLGSSKFLMFIGAYTMAIYLMNTMAIGVAKGVMLKIMDWNGVNFLFFAPVLMVIGIMAPLLLKLLVFKHIRWLDRITQ